jgi:hypothetical protein
MKWTLYGSPSVTIHLIRGVIGSACLVVALIYSPVMGRWTVIPGAAALVSFGGCPMCWIVGLGGTILRGDPISLCLNGSCSKRKSTSDSVAAEGESDIMNFHQPDH